MNGGYIKIDKKLIEHILDFEGATILGVKMDYFNRLEILLEHPDLPEVRDGDEIPGVYTAYSVDYGDNGIAIRIQRIEPPKKDICVKYV